VRRFVLLGPPGVGKGTQAAFLAEHLGIPAVSTGDLFRAHVRERTPIGARVSAILDAGDYVPDSIVDEMVAGRLAATDAADGFLLDGYPRTATQVESLDAMLAANGQALDAVLVLDGPDEMLVERLLLRGTSSGRSDDTAEQIGHRLAVYRSETAPLAALYRARGLVHAIDGTGPIGQVRAAIRTILTAGTTVFPQYS
jgi:adenylate kinase